MHPHPNARLTAGGRAQVFAAVEAGMTVSAACLAFRVSRRCYYRWRPRWDAQGKLGLHDRDVGAHDRLVAATAVATGWRVATANVRNFERITGVQVVSPNLTE